MARPHPAGSLLPVVDRLLAEFERTFSAGSVARCVQGCADDLAGSALTDGLPEVVERLARFRLQQAAELATPLLTAELSA